MKLVIRNIPIYLAYYVLPLISFLYGITIGGKCLNYEIIWLFLLPVIVVLVGKQTLSRKVFACMSIVLFLFLCKYIFPILWVESITWRAFFIDVKWICYLLLALLWINSSGGLDTIKFYRAGRNFCYLYILYFLLLVLRNGEYHRFELLSESNYDCFLFLMPFCFIQEAKGSRRDYWVFGLATFLSGSKTGIVSFLVLLLYPFYQRSRYKFLYWLFFFLCIIGYAYFYFIRRGIGDVGEIDRVLFFAQFFEYLRGCNWSVLLGGVFPGKAMEFHQILPEFTWYINHFENMNGITGCYPFYFHSTYMRLAIVWGLPLVLLLIISLLFVFFRTKDVSFRHLILLFFLESISLSSLSLTTVSLIFFLIFLTVAFRKPIFNT